MAWGIGPGRRGVLPLLHLRGHRRGDAAGRRLAGVRGHRRRTPTTSTPPSLDAAIEAVKREGKLTPRAVIAVDLFGQPADYPAIAAVCAQARPEADRRLRPGLRLHAGRQAPDPLGRRRHHLVLPGQAARLLRRRRRGALARTRGSTTCWSRLRVHGQAVKSDIEGQHLRARPEIPERPHRHERPDGHHPGRRPAARS